MKKLLEFLQHNGTYSSTRLFMLLVCFTFIFTWIYSVVTYREFNPSIELLTFVGITLGLKVVEGFKR